MSKLHKNYKVRRFGQIYPSHRSTPSIVLRTVLTVTIVCALGFVGWNAYGPVRDYFTGALAAAVHRQEAPPVSVSEPEPEAPPPEPEPPAQPRAAYLPGFTLSDPVLFDAALARLEDLDCNAVMFDLKDASGTVLYQSGSELVAGIDAQADNAYDLEAICGRLTDRGLIPVGRISAFADPVAAVRLEGAGIKYMNTNMTWLDNSQENGGKGWLNPYSEAARSYLSALITEAASLGVKRIVLDQYSFPTGVGLEFANYGENAASIPQAAALAATMTVLEQEASAHDCVLSLYVSGPAALGEQNRYYGDQNPLGLSDTITLGLMPAQFGDGYTTEGFTLETPVQLPYETVNRLLERLSPALSGKEVTAMVQGYTATGALASNKVYKLADVEEQLRALEENQIESYIIYSPEGSYPTE